MEATVPSSSQLLYSIMVRLLELLPDEPRKLKQLNDIIESDPRAGKALVESALRAPGAGSAQPASTRDVPASGVRPKRSRPTKRSAVS
jgi:hypothetical protein